jgi:hypothetical protein
MNVKFLLSRLAVLTVAVILFMHGSAALGQQSIAGTLHNGTTGKAAVGDQVLLLRLNGNDGMVEESRTKSGERGSFTLPFNFPKSPHIVRALHTGVNYDRVLAPADPADIEVFDAGPRISGISGYATIVKVESDGAVFNITELQAIENESNPPKTQLNNQNMELQLPTKSTLDSVTILAPHASTAVKATPLLIGSTNYVIGFPLRPGITQYAVRYHLAYPDRVLFHPLVLYPTRQWSVVFPRTMTFMERRPGTFRSIIDQNGIRVEAVKDVRPGPLPAFEISGAGALPPLQTSVTSRTTALPPSSSRTATKAASDRSQDKGNKKMGSPMILVFVCIVFLASSLLIARFWFATRRAALQQLKEDLFELENARIRKAISAKEYSEAKRLIEQHLARAVGVS